jgi:hypothetical protein
MGYYWPVTEFDFARVREISFQSQICLEFIDKNLSLKTRCIFGLRGLL